MPAARRILLALGIVAVLRPALGLSQAPPTVPPTAPPAAVTPAVPPGTVPPPTPAGAMPPSTVPPSTVPPNAVPPGTVPSPAGMPATGPSVGPSIAPVVPRGVSVQEVGPKVYYLKDKDGNLVLVPDFTFERYEELVAREIAQGAPKPPAYSFADVVRFKCKADRDQAEIDAVFPLRFVSTAETSGRWIRVPLEMKQGVLVAPPTLEGQGEVFLEYRLGDEGYIAWVRPKSEGLQRLTLKLRVPLTQVDSEKRLVLSLVRAPVRLDMEVAATGVEGRVGTSDENMLSIERPDTQRTLLVVDGTGGNLELAWQEKSERPTMLEANGSLLISVTGERVECNAKLKVRSYGAPIDAFSVRLPPEMDLVAGSQPGFRITTVADPEAGAGSGQRVLVQRLEGKTSEPMNVQLVAWRPSQRGGQRVPIEVGGFEVIGAVRQWGAMDIAVEGEWQVDFTAGPNLQRVDSAGEAARQQNLVARFEYFRQPWSLAVELIPKQTRLSVDPIYVYQVDPTRVRLEATLRYKTSGGRPRDARIDLGGWVLDRVTPPELVAEPLNVDSLTPLRIPIAAQALPASGEFVLRVEAHRDLAAGQPLMLGPLRCPEATAAPALVVLAAAENAELVPDATATVGLVPDTLPAALDATRFAATPLVYREEPSAEGAVFVGRVRKRDRSVKVRITTRLQATGTHLLVDQTYACEVAYEALQRMEFESPVPAKSLVDLRVTCGGQDLAWKEDVAASAKSSGRIVADLPQGKLGSFTAQVRYRFPLTAMKLNVPQSVKLPLLQSRADAQTTVSQNVLNLLPVENVAIESVDESWNVQSSGLNPAQGDGVAQYVAEGPHAAVSLTATLVPPRRRQTTVVEKVWLQVWLTRNERRDRAVFLLDTSQEQLEFHLPPRALTDGLEVWVAGSPLKDVVAQGNRVVRIPLEKHHRERKLTIELFYWFKTIDPPVARLTVEAPTVTAADRPDRCYWQLVLPGSEYLLWSPEQLANETIWRWQGAAWGREPNLKQSELEDSLAASHQPTLPVASNQYLFSSLGTMSPCIFVSAKRQVVLLSLSGAVLVAGLLLLYFPSLRHPGLWLVAAVALATAGLLYPDLALLAAQAAVLGVALVPLARLMRWVFSRRRVALGELRSPAASRSDSRISELTTRPGEGSSRTGTAPHYRVPVESQT